MQYSVRYIDHHVACHLPFGYRSLDMVRTFTMSTECLTGKVGASNSLSLPGEAGIELDSLCTASKLEIVNNK